MFLVESYTHTHLFVFQKITLNQVLDLDDNSLTGMLFSATQQLVGILGVAQQSIGLRHSSLTIFNLEPTNIVIWTYPTTA